MYGRERLINAERQARFLACPEPNGGHERMHRDMKKELQGKIDVTLGEH